MLDPVCFKLISGHILLPVETGDVDFELQVHWNGCKVVCGAFSEELDLTDFEKDHLKSYADSGFISPEIEKTIFNKVKSAFKNMALKNLRLSEIA